MIPAVNSAAAATQTANDAAAITARGASPPTPKSRARRVVVSCQLSVVSCQLSVLSSQLMDFRDYLDNPTMARASSIRESDEAGRKLF